MISEVYNVDCLSFLESYGGGTIKLVVTDPPYKIDSWDGGPMMRTKEKLEWIKQMDVDNLSMSYNIQRFAELLLKAQGGNINAYFFCNKAQIPEYFRIYVGELGCKYDILSWHKTNALPTFHGKYLTDTEYILYFRNKGGCNPQSYDDAKTYFIGEINIADKRKWKHPTIKPINIVRTLVRNSSSPGDLVFDGFLGSGTTRIACYHEGRNFLGCELDKSFYDLQEKRYQQECHGIEVFGEQTYIQSSLWDLTPATALPGRPSTAPGPE